MDLISVIVPVYKVEKYLDCCVQSIVDQTYTNLEIILVDDGSPDNCPAMCDAWAMRDNRIRVIHKKNGGLSDARNAGMAVATGVYIAFVDSDDWVDSRYISAMYQSIGDTDAGIAACDIRFVTEGEAVPPTSEWDGYRVCAPEEAIADILVGQGFRAVACNKLYHRRYLAGEKYPVGKHHEDEFFTYRILAKAEKLVFVKLPLYNYLQRSGSIMHTITMKRLDALDAYLERLAFLKPRFPELYRRDKITFCVSCAAFYRQGLGMKDPERTTFLEKIRTSRKQVRFSVNEFLHMPSREQLYVLSTAISLDLFCRLHNNMKGKTFDV